MSDLVQTEDARVWSKLKVPKAVGRCVSGQLTATMGLSSRVVSDLR